MTLVHVPGMYTGCYIFQEADDDFDSLNDDLDNHIQSGWPEEGEAPNLMVSLNFYAGFEPAPILSL